MIDIEDFDRINSLSWSMTKRGYAISYRKRPDRTYISMHRFIMNCPDDMVVDHINGNTLDNRKQNLRICTIQQNLCNRKMHKNNTTGYKGVRFHKSSSSWYGRITHKGKVKHLGSFKTPQEAAEAYNKASKEIHGKFGQHEGKPNAYN